MTTFHAPDGHVYETHTDIIEYDVMSAPDPGWRHVDTNGHEHRWIWDDGKPTTPSLVWVKTGEEWYEDDDEPHDIGHLECQQCGERVHPGTRAEHGAVRGLTYCYIDGVSVPEEEFRTRVEPLLKSLNS